MDPIAASDCWRVPGRAPLGQSLPRKVPAHVDPGSEGAQSVSGEQPFGAAQATAPGQRRRELTLSQGADTLELATAGHWRQALACSGCPPCQTAEDQVLLLGPRNVLLVEQAEKGRECSQVRRGHPGFSGQWGRGTSGVGRRPAPGTSDWQVLLSSRVMFGKLLKSAVPVIARL